MKTDLSHLPVAKRQELERIVKILLEEFARTVDQFPPPEGVRADGRIVKVILYGSHARGDWVDDARGQYFSDFDILVVVNRSYLLEDPGLLLAAEKRLAKTASLRTPISFITEDFGAMNSRIGNNEYFYVDVVNEGIVLYEVDNYRFTAPRNLSPQGRYDYARKYFDFWMGSAEQFLGTHDLQVTEGWKGLATFSLHQATEKAYHCLLLVLTCYQPRTHDLKELAKYTSQYDPRLSKVWPDDSRFTRRCFQLLRRAYVGARYSEQFEITPEEINWLRGQVETLHKIVRNICIERLKALKIKAEKAAISE